MQREGETEAGSVLTAVIPRQGSNSRTMSQAGAPNQIHFKRNDLPTCVRPLQVPWGTLAESGEALSLVSPEATAQQRKRRWSPGQEGEGRVTALPAINGYQQLSTAGQISRAVPCSVEPGNGCCVLWRRDLRGILFF